MNDYLDYIQHDGLIYVNTSYLEHHGIKGMKWGVRRFEDASGHLTPAGKKRYDQDILDNAKKYDRAKANIQTVNNAYKRNPNKHNLTQLHKSNVELNIAKKHYKDSQHYKHASDIKNKSKHRLSLEDKYKKMGMNDREAAIQADKRIKTEKILAVTAGVAVGALAVHGVKRYNLNNKDSVIKSGTKLNRLVADKNNLGIEDAFYASKGQRESNKYKGLYGRELHAKGASNIYEAKLNVTKDMKIASRNNARKAMEKVLRDDPQLAKEMADNLTKRGALGVDKRSAVVRAGANDLSKSNYSKHLYDAIETGLGDASNATNVKFRNKFYGELKKQGYDGIKDLNDMMYDAYKSKSATIVFTGKNKVGVDHVNKISDKEYSKLSNIETAKVLGRTTFESAAKTGGLIGGILAVNKGTKVMNDSSRNNRLVAEYRKKHPDSKLSYNDIVENYERNH